MARVVAHDTERGLRVEHLCVGSGFSAAHVHLIAGFPKRENRCLGADPVDVLHGRDAHLIAEDVREVIARRFGFCDGPHLALGFVDIGIALRVWRC